METNTPFAILEFLCSATPSKEVQSRAPDLAAQRYFWLHEIQAHLQLGSSEVMQSCQELKSDGLIRSTGGPIDSMNQPIRATKEGRARWIMWRRKQSKATEKQKPNRSRILAELMQKPIWEEADVALFYNVTVDTLRHMKSRNEIPGIVQTNLRTWHIHRDAFLEHFKQRGMPKSSPGRPKGSKNVG